MTDQKRSKITEVHLEEAARLKAIWNDGRARRGQAEFGEAYGLGSQANVGHYLNGRNPLNAKAALAFAAELKCEIADFSLRLADELKTLTQGDPSVIPLSGYKTQPETGDIVIPQYDTGGAMGGGRLLLAEQPGLIKSWHVDHEWVRLNVKHYTSLSNLCIVTGFGNSMKPMFNPGDPLLIDKGVNHVDHDGIFFFRVGEHGFIKQIQRIPDPMTGAMLFRAKSMNDAQYDPFDIHPSNPQFAVLGKVLTVWKSEQY